MNAREKAHDLFESYDILMDTYYNYNYDTTDVVKRCSIITVNEIMKAVDEIPITNQNDYWNRVKIEIEKL